MAFNKEIRLFFLTILGLVVYVRGDRTVNVQRQTGCNEGVSLSQGNIKCDLITCPSETDLCYVLKIYDAQNSIIGRENICYAKDKTVLAYKSDAPNGRENSCYGKDKTVLAYKSDAPNGSAASTIKELTLHSNANFEYFSLNKVERSIKTMSDIKEYVAKKKEEERISFEEYNTNMAIAQNNMNMKRQEMGQIESKFSVEMAWMMGKIGNDMSEIGQRMAMIGNIHSEKLKDIQHVFTSDINNYCRYN